MATFLKKMKSQLGSHYCPIFITFQKDNNIMHLLESLTLKESNLYTPNTDDFLSTDFKIQYIKNYIMYWNIYVYETSKKLYDVFEKVENCSSHSLDEDIFYFISNSIFDEKNAIKKTAQKSKHDNIISLAKKRFYKKTDLLQILKFIPGIEFKKENVFITLDWTKHIKSSESILLFSEKNNIVLFVCKQNTKTFYIFMINLVIFSCFCLKKKGSDFRERKYILLSCSN